MIHIPKSENLPSLARLEEETIAKIKQVPIPNIDNTFYGPEEIEELFYALYEIEYKYNKIKQSEFVGVERRRENLLRILSKKGSAIVEELQKTFVWVFESWLNAHDLEDPYHWAESRLEDFESEPIRMILDAIIGEFSRYVNVRENSVYPQFLRELQTRVFEPDSGMIHTRELIEENIREGLRSLAESDLQDVEAEYMELEKWNEMYNVEATSLEDAYDWLDSVSYAIPLEEMDLTDIYPFGEGSDELAFVIQGPREDEILTEIEAEVIFPLWFNHWKREGLVDTRATVEKVFHMLQKVDTLPIERQFMVLNIAKNTSHQNGSMMEYYTDRWGLDYDFFKKLSQTDVSEWDDELEEIGFLL